MLWQKNKNYMIILMELEGYEIDVLFEHTRRRRQRRREQLRTLYSQESSVQSQNR